MATFNKVNSFVELLAEGVHNLESHTFKVALVNGGVSAATTKLGDLTEIADSTGYTTGGTQAAVSSSAQTSGTYKLVLADPTKWTGSGAGMGPFRYAVLYNDTPTSPYADPVVGYWDYGSSITLAAGEEFTVDFDATNGVLQLV